MQAGSSFIPHQKILITGGAGFIGSGLVAHAVRNSAEILVVDALTYAGHAENLRFIDALSYPGSYKLEVANILDGQHMLALMQSFKPTAIIHAAAESHVDNSIKSASAFMETNVLGTQVMLDAARQYMTQMDATTKTRFRFVQISTDEVYGALGEDGVFTTRSPLMPNSPYAASKAAADLLVRAWRVTHGVPTLITRCCNNYGPRQHPEKLIPRMITRALAGETLTVYGSGEQVREWIHVEDHARGVFRALKQAEVGSVTHIGSGVEYTNLEIIHLICECLQAETGRDYTHLITHVEDRLGHDFRYALDVSQTELHLGFSARIGFEEGLKTTVKWYLENNDWVQMIEDHTRAKRSAA